MGQEAGLPSVAVQHGRGTLHRQAGLAWTAPASKAACRHAALFQKVKLLKNPKGKRSIHRAIVRRVLAVTLIVAGVSMLMSGIGTALVH